MCGELLFALKTRERKLAAAICSQTFRAQIGELLSAFGALECTLAICICSQDS